MSKVKIGLLTIGQSPRDDLVPEIKPLFSPHIELVEYGLLDELSSEEIKFLAPDTGEMPLATRLKDGSQVQLGEKKVNGLLRKAIDLMIENMKVKALGMLCTHEFSITKPSCPIVSPFHYLKFLVDEILEVRTLGVLVPLESQMERTKKKWEREKVIVEAKSPYVKGKTWKEISKIFMREKTEAIILDCIGYKIDDRRRIQNLIPVPVLLPRAILAHAFNQLFSYKD
jgi:protein AroM